MSVIVWLLGAGILQAQPKSGPAEHPPLLSVSDITIPSELGYVLERHAATSISHPTIVVHIQESHADYETQRHLASILEHLIQRYGLKRILVEGGEGNVGLSYLRSYGPLENRKAIAEKYLKVGLLSGEEYLDIVSDFPLLLWGIEQKALYDQHVKAFLEVEVIAPSLEAILQDVRDAAETLRPKVFSPVLVDLMTSIEAFDAGAIELTDYADRLSSLAKGVGISKEYTLHTRRFETLRELERTLDFERVQKEQGSLIEELGRRLNPEAFDDLTEQARALGQDDPSLDAFYHTLKRLAESSGIASTQYPQLFQYIEYLTEGSKLDPVALADELEQLVQELLTRLGDSPAARQLSSIEQQRLLVEKFVMLRLSPKEHQRFRLLSPEDMLPMWNRFLTGQALVHGLKAPSLEEGLQRLQVAWPVLERFYNIAMERDEVLVQKTLEQLNQASEEPVVVLISGGFHSPGITQRLRKQGVNVIVVTPATNQVVDEAHYHAVLKYKNGYGRLEDVRTPANQTVAEDTSRAE